MRIVPLLVLSGPIAILSLSVPSSTIRLRVYPKGHVQRRELGMLRRGIGPLRLRDRGAEDSSGSIVDDGAEEEGRSRESWESVLLLNGVAVLFGSQHAVIKSTLDVFPSPSVVNLWRFLSSALLFSPALVTLLRDRPKILQEEVTGTTEISSGIWQAGAELGLYTFLGFAFQAIGMETTSASKSAFLLYLNVKFVPFLGFVLFQKQISTATWISALLAFTGTFLLSSDGTGIVEGDLWTIAAAAASAMFILRLETFSRKFDAAQLNAVNFSVVALLCSMWVAVDATFLQGNHGLVLEDIYGAVVKNPFPIVYLGVITTALCNYLQTLGQRDVSAEKAAIIYSMDPVYGALFSYWLLGEQLGSRGFAGAGLILLGVWLSAQQPQTQSLPATEE